MSDISEKISSIRQSAEKRAISDSDARVIAAITAAAMSAKKGMEIEVLHVGPLTAVADYFVICTGTSNTQIKSIADEIEHQIEQKNGYRPTHVEGYTGASWILLDYGAVVAHVFHKDSRQFYQLERLWVDAARLDVEDLIKSLGDVD